MADPLPPTFTIPTNTDPIPDDGDNIQETSFIINLYAPANTVFDTFVVEVRSLDGIAITNVFSPGFDANNTRIVNLTSGTRHNVTTYTQSYDLNSVPATSIGNVTTGLLRTVESNKC